MASTLSVAAATVLASTLSVADASVLASTLSVAARVDMNADARIAGCLSVALIEHHAGDGIMRINTNQLILNNKITIGDAITMNSDVVQNSLYVNEQVVADNFYSPDDHLKLHTPCNVIMEGNNIEIAASNSLVMKGMETLTLSTKIMNIDDMFHMDSTLDREERTKLAFTFCNDVRIFGTLACGSITINAFEEKERIIDLTTSHVDGATSYPSIMIGEEISVNDTRAQVTACTFVATEKETVFMKPVYFLHDAYFSSNLKIDPIFELSVECKKDLIVRGEVYGKNGGEEYGKGDELHIRSPTLMSNCPLKFINTNTQAEWQVYVADSVTSNVGDLTFLSKNLSGFAIPDELNETVDVVNFTGQHRCTSRIRRNTKNKDDITEFIGKIVVATGEFSDLSNKSKIRINEAVPIIDLAKTKRDPRVFGVVSDQETDDKTRTMNVGAMKLLMQKTHRCRKVIVNSVGEGGVWICDTNGPLKNGDLITTSSVAGYGMRQDEEWMASWTLGKITCDCDFNPSSKIYECEELIVGGRKVGMRAFVGCTYKC